MSEQAIAARLTAIAERLKRFDRWDYEQLQGDCEFLLAHVETLTQQVAELTQQRDEAFAADCYNCRNLEQENARLTADRFVQVQRAVDAEARASLLLENEAILLRKLSDALTHGNASTWAEVLHSARENTNG